MDTVKCISNKEKQIIKELTGKYKKHIAITFHNSPDGDAIGSAIALTLALRKIGKDAEIVCNKMSHVYDGLLKEYKINIVHHVRKYYNLTIMLDCSDRQRTVSCLEGISDYMIVIDHHANCKPIGNIYFYKNEPATALILYNLINQFTSIDADIATALYLGIVSDTCNFTTENVDANTHNIAGDLIMLGANLKKVNDIYNMKHLSLLKLVGKTFSHIVFDNDYKILYLVLMHDEIESANATYDDASALIDILKNTVESDVTYLIMESGNNTKIKARSNGNVDVSAILKYFDGGGHKNAAGACVNSANVYGIAELIVEYTKKCIDNAA